MPERPVTEEAIPIGEAEFASLMHAVGPFGPDVAAAPLVVAVSGGADSMALAFLMRKWRRHLQALIVDHGLRAESVQEAALTQQRLEGMGVPSRILALPPLRPGRVQERAREGRFEALEQACRAAGGVALFLAHHAADQEETIWMRHEARSGAAGLAGIASSGLRGRVRIVRPLLTVAPERLKATLRAAGLPWCEDPSNRNRRFTRVRLRQDMTPAQRRQAWILRETAIRLRAGQEDALAGLLARHAVWKPEGWVILREAALKEPQAETVLSALIRLVRGGRYRPCARSVRRILETQEGSLGGVVLRKAGRWGDGLILMRESRNLEEPVAAREGVVWDGRWRFLGPARPECLIAPLGEKAPVPKGKSSCPALVRRSLPGLWRDGRLVALPDEVFPGETGEKAAFAWDGGVPVTGESVF